MKRTCSRCENPKHIKDFHRDKSKRDGRTTICKVCKSKAGKKWREKNQELHRARSKKWAEENRERSNASKRKWKQKNPKKNKMSAKKYRENNPDLSREADLIKNFDMTIAEYKAMLANQEWLCAACGLALEMGGRHHPVDHDHSKKGRESVRGIVHQRCNILIGIYEFFIKNPDFHDRIRRHVSRQGPLENDSLDR